MVRLVFRPYTQVGRSICTSESLRTSTRVSSGFVLLGHSSPSFGSQRVRSCSASSTRRTRRAGGAPHGRGRTDPTQAGRRPGLHFHCAFGFRSAQRLAHMLDSLVRVSRRVGQVTGRFATDPRRDAGPSRRCGRAVRGHWNQSPRVERDNTTGGRRRSATVFLGPPTGRRSPGLYAPAHEAKVTLPGRFSPPPNPPRRAPAPRASAPPGAVVSPRRAAGGAAPPAESTAAARRTDAGALPRGMRGRRRRRTGGLNPTGGPYGPFRLPLDGFTYC